MEFGCHLPMLGARATRRNLVSFVKRVEALRYHSVWVRDHVILPWHTRSRYPYTDVSPTGQYPLRPDENFLEALTTLAMVAGVTERIKLGTTVLILPHRHPVLTAKMLATLDYLSNGRVILGAGVGWLEEEIELFGIPYHRRGAWSDEAIRIMRTCWGQYYASYHGEFFQFSDLACFPKPINRTIPIWIAGHSSHALRRTAELGDGWHPAYLPPEQLEDALRILRRECARVGRSMDDIRVSLRAIVSFQTPKCRRRRPLEGTPEEIVGDLKRYQTIGVELLVIEMSYDDPSDPIEFYERFVRDICPQI